MEKEVTTLSPAQMERLAPYEKNMACAVRSDYTRGLSRTGLDVVRTVLDEVTGRKNYVCGSCQFSALDVTRRVGRLYFATKEANAAVEATAPAQVEQTTAKQKKARKTKSKAQ